MKNYKIARHDTSQTLFCGYFKDFKTCLETAISNKINLHYADLSAQNLTNANLDDGVLSHADFSKTNLSGANLSETYCKGANFSESSLFNTCFAYSNLNNCNFTDAEFGATDIIGSIIDGATFSTLSAFTLNFTTTRQMKDCHFITEHGEHIEFSEPPITIQGLSKQPTMIIGDKTFEGHKRIHTIKNPADLFKMQKS